MKCAIPYFARKWAILDTLRTAQVLRSTVIPFNIILNYLLLDILPSAYASMCCLIVVSGFVLGSITELNFSAEGFAYGIISSILVALYSSSVKKILPGLLLDHSGAFSCQASKLLQVQGRGLLKRSK